MFILPSHPLYFQGHAWKVCVAGHTAMVFTEHLYATDVDLLGSDEAITYWSLIGGWLEYLQLMLISLIFHFRWIECISTLMLLRVMIGLPWSVLFGMFTTRLLMGFSFSPPRVQFPHSENTCLQKDILYFVESYSFALALTVLHW
jgi:Fe2+ transport system protein B